MKKLIALLLIGIMLLAGCQNTPEKPVVQGKDTEQLINAAGSNEENITIVEMLNAPDRLVLTKTDGSGKVTVNADAEIIIPDSHGISMTRIEGKNFTQEEADRILAYFIGEGEFNNRYEIGYDEQVESLIQWKADLARETDPKKREALQASIDKFESAGITVPDNPQEVEPASRVFVPVEHVGDQISGYCKTDGGSQYLNIVNHPEEHQNFVFYTKEQNGYNEWEGAYYYENEIGNAEKVGFDPTALSQMQLTLTKEDARNKAQEALAALGIEGMVLSTIEEVWGGTQLKGGVIDSQARRAYQLRYVRSLNGVPLTYTDNKIDGGMVDIDEVTNERVSYNWRYENVHFIIDDTGIVEFVWESPYEIVETVAESSALKQFDEIADVFSTMMLVKNAVQDQDMLLTFNISRAQLGLTRITEKNKSDTALLVPVWDFFGTMTMEYTDESGNRQSVIIEGIHTSQLTVNAIDGSIIDRYKGH